MGDAVAALLDAKAKAGRRLKYRNVLRQNLNQFARGRESLPLDQLTIEDIEAWFDGRNDQPSTRISTINRLSTLFSFAIRRGWLTDNPCRRLEPIREDQRVPRILSVDEAQDCLVWAARRQPRMLGWLVLALMAGVRPEEAEKVAWSDINLEAGTVRIDAAASKVRRRRIVHLMPAAVEWLQAAQAKGADLPLGHNSRRRCLRRLRVILGWSVWPQDILRHTAASYWLAEWSDAGRVAHELGNSPDVLVRRYKEIVEKSEAHRFWNLKPNGILESHTQLVLPLDP